jgi:phage N-6-adenine-methyltransferase
MKLGALKSAATMARRIKDWGALDKAVKEIIAEQREFVSWWNKDVSPGETRGLKIGSKPAVTKTGQRATIPARDATAGTGITKQQVSKWRGRLENEKTYHDALFNSGYAQMWAVNEEQTRGTTGTGENEWFTPKQYIKLARDVLGTIDLDPASSEKAQKVVKAEKYFTKDDSGLENEWKGRVWLNPPYAQPLISEFVTKLITEVSVGRVSEAILLTHNYTDTSWFHQAAGISSAICFTRGRIQFYNAQGEIAAPTQGQAFFYYGRNVKKFVKVFSDTGFISKFIME